MWGVLRADFKEFVSTVTEDTTSALSAIDTNLDVRDSDENGKRQTRAPLIDPDTGLVVDEGEIDEDAVNGEENEDDEASVDDSREEELLSKRTPEEMWGALCVDEATFTTPLVVEGTEDASILSFLESFDVSTQTDTITKLLEEHSDTLQATFTKVASESDVSYEDFWKRYFYRCDDVERRTTYYNDVYVPRRLAEIESRRDLRQKQREEIEARANVPSSLASVTNFLGGAVKALVKDDAVPQDATTFANASNQPQQTAAGALQFFNNSGRPPFVMNTAVEESFDNDEDEEEDEEELGWDDDDDDDDDDEDDYEDEEGVDNESNVAGSEQIEFNDAEKDRLKEELTQALEERDQLHRTVEMQTEEIKSLKEKSMGITSSPTETEKLKMQLFEKDAEIAAMKASLDDTHEDDTSTSNKSSPDGASKIASQERELGRLTSELAAKNKEVADLLKRLTSTERNLASNDNELQAMKSLIEKNSNGNDQMKSQLATATSQVDTMSSALANSETEKSNLQAALAEAQTAASKLQAENANLQALVQSAGSDSAAQLAVAQKDVADAIGKLSGLQIELDDAHIALAQATQQNSGLSSEVDALKKLLAEKEEELAAKTQLVEPSSPGSNSTGIKVSADSPPNTDSVDPVVSRLEPSENSDADDGWGDDW